MMRRIRTPLAAMASLVLALGACSSSDDGTASAVDDVEGTELVGLFAVDAGVCTDSGAAGSWFRMVQPGGTPENGPFMDNGDSACEDKSWSPLAPGSEGGFTSGAFQPQVEPFFDEGGNSTSRSILAPTKFFAVGFGLSTNETDPQTDREVPPPTVRVGEDGALVADLSALSVSWNEQHFNQGSPKPGAAGPAASGTYDPDSGAYTLEWTSLIEGGPFDGFTGIWHFEGVFTAS